MEKFNFADLKNAALLALESVNTLEQFVEVKNTYLSKKGLVNELMSKLKDIKNEDKKDYGKAVNNLKELLTDAFEVKETMLKQVALNKKLEDEKLDLTLPGTSFTRGGQNPIFLVKDEIEQVFISMGYKVAEGPEVELDHYNFELLNIAKDHPARDMQDSFYIDANTLLRTHTSPVQARVMEQNKSSEVIKIVCPGKVYRRDDDDMTHSHQFMQVEGLLIGKNINLGHLKATLELFIKQMFGEKRTIRFRSSYFPFTEPSVEVDVSWNEAKKEEDIKWIEILGAGMVNPDVLKANGFDPTLFSGFAFGIGIERVAMLRYGVDDIRRFYQSDLRFINQFK